MEMPLQGDSRLARITMYGQILNRRFFSDINARADRDFPSSRHKTHGKRIECDKFPVVSANYIGFNVEYQRLLYLWPLRDLYEEFFTR